MVILTRQTDRTDRRTDGEAETDRDTETDRERDRQTDTDRDRDRGVGVEEYVKQGQDNRAVHNELRTGLT